MRVLIVGSGCTGALVSHYLRERWPQPAEVEIHLWERGRGPGGRMSTTWMDIDGTRAKADMGAQLLSVKRGNSHARMLVNLLLEAGVLYPAPLECIARTAERGLGDMWEHYVGSSGLSAVPGHFIREASTKCSWERLLQSLHVDGNMVVVDSVHAKTRARLPRERFNVVCLTMRTREVFEVGGQFKRLLDPWSEVLQQVRYDQRFSVALFLDPALKDCLDRFFGSAWEIIPDNHPAIELLVYQTPRMRDADFDMPVVVIHSTVTFARSFYRLHPPSGRGDPKDPAVKIMAEHLAQLTDYEDLPAAVVQSKVLNWRKSQVLQSARLGHAAARLTDIHAGGASVVLAGDYFTESSFSGCAATAMAAAEELTLALTSEVEPSAPSTAASDEKSRPEGMVRPVDAQKFELLYAQVEEPVQKTASSSEKGRWRLRQASKLADGEQAPTNGIASSAGYPQAKGRGRGRGRRWQPRGTE